MTLPGKHEDVRRVGSAWEQAVFQHLPSRRRRTPAGNHGPVVALAGRAELRHLDAIDELHRQDGSSRAIQWTRGTNTVSSPARFWRNRSMVRPSRARSCSRRMARANSRTSLVGCKEVGVREVPFSQAGEFARESPGRLRWSADSRPPDLHGPVPRRPARPGEPARKSEAAAIGTGSNSAYTSPTGLPSSAAMVASATPDGSGGTSS